MAPVRDWLSPGFYEPALGPAQFCSITQGNRITNSSTCLPCESRGPESVIGLMFATKLPSSTTGFPLSRERRALVQSKCDCPVKYRNSAQGLQEVFCGVRPELWGCQGLGLLLLGWCDPGGGSLKSVPCSSASCLRWSQACQSAFCLCSPWALPVAMWRSITGVTNLATRDS